ncbi:MAG: YcxB family protein [Clostridia bacterium]|nr:YcxB family protein [Clostridia bacterium]
MNGFTNRTPLNGSTMFDLNWFDAQRRHAVRKLRMPLAIFAALSFTALAVYVGSTSQNWITAAFIFVFAPVMIVIPLLSKRRSRKNFIAYVDKNSEAMGVGFVNEFVFGKGSFTVSNGTSTETVHYNQLQHVFETRRNFFLYKSDQIAYIVDKNRFTEGNSADFAAFIKDKCAGIYHYGPDSVKKKKAKRD